MDPGIPRPYQPRRENLGCFEGGITDFRETARRGRTRTSRCTPVMAPVAAMGAVEAAGEVKTAEEEAPDDGETRGRSDGSTEEVVRGDAAADRRRRRQRTPLLRERVLHVWQERPKIADCADKLFRRCNRWGYTSDDVCAMAKEDIVLAATRQGRARDARGDDGTIGFSSFKAEGTQARGTTPYAECAVGS